MTNKNKQRKMFFAHVTVEILKNVLNFETVSQYKNVSNGRK